jgi:hypothetical protein
MWSRPGECQISGEFGGSRIDPQCEIDVGPDFIASTAQILDEGVPDDDRLGGVVP